MVITNKSGIEENKLKKGVVFSSRVHPGETVGSFVMEGILDFLTGETPEADFLRSAYIFKIVPMLNPDGVINGNYRCNLVGADLNRRWKTPNPVIHPVVHHFKKLIHSFHRTHDIELICDLHGHSRKKNIFAYGCND